MKQKGVIIAIKDSVAFTLEATPIDPGRRYLILTINPILLWTCTCLIPTKFASWKECSVRLPKSRKAPWLCVGTRTADYTIDTTSKSKKPLPKLQPVLHSEDVYDVWRCQHAGEWDLTFHSSSHNSYSRIDLILVDKLLLQAVSSTIHDISWSDHASVSITVVEGHTPSPTYLWRANSHIFQVTSHVATITQNFTEFFSLNDRSVASAATLWCAHKAFIRGLLLQICSLEKRQRTQRLSVSLGKLSP